MKILLIWNSRAGHGRAARALDEVRPAFARHGVDLEVALTERRRHATEIVSGTSLARYDGVIAGGGDGTVFETLNGLFDNPAGPCVPFGVCPVGTGNSFSLDLGLERGRLDRAIDAIVGGRTREVDVGRCITANGGFHYLNILGAGFVTDVTASASRLKLLGNGAYTLGVLYRTVFLNTFGLHLEFDGRVVERDATFLEISNSRYTADFLMAPDARIDDGLLDITVLGRISRRRLLRLFPTVFRGEHVRHPEVETFTAQEIKVSTEVSKVLSPDGELEGRTPFEVSCLHRALRVFASA